MPFAPVGESAYNWLVATFVSSGLRVSVVEDWRALKWSKLALNVVANASCAILNVLPARMVHFEKILYPRDSHDSRGDGGDVGDEARGRSICRAIPCAR